MSEQAPDFSLENISSKRDGGKPAIYLVKHFQVGEANYMKPPLEEQLVDPDGSIPSSTQLKSACTCNSVCTCVPVTTCACNTVCTCNTVSQTYKVVTTTRTKTSTSRSRSSRSTRTRSSGGGGGGYWAPCF